MTLCNLDFTTAIVSDRLNTNPEQMIFCGEDQMKININVKRTFTINGKQYNSIEEMPEDVRKSFEKARSSHEGTGRHIQITQTTKNMKITFNGTEYDSIETMPQDARQIYDKVLKAAETSSSPEDIDLSGIMLNGTDTTGALPSTGQRQQIKFESASSQKKIVTAVVLAGIFLLLFFLFHK